MPDVVKAIEANDVRLDKRSTVAVSAHTFAHITHGGGEPHSDYDDSPNVNADDGGVVQGS